MILVFIGGVALGIAVVILVAAVGVGILVESAHAEWKRAERDDPTGS